MSPGRLLWNLRIWYEPYFELKIKNAECNVMVADYISRVKMFVKRNENNIVLFVGVVLVSVASFGLGRIVALRQEKTPIQIIEQEASPKIGEAIGDTRVVASKQGARYYYEWCSGAERLKESNKIWFESASAAEAAGYTLAANCEGL